MQFIALITLMTCSAADDDDTKELLPKKQYNEIKLNICGGTKLIDGMNKQRELNFQCKSNDKRFKSKCRVKCGDNLKGRTRATARKVYCVQSNVPDEVKMVWGNKQGKEYDLKKFGCKSNDKQRQEPVEIISREFKIPNTK